MVTSTLHLSIMQVLLCHRTRSIATELSGDLGSDVDMTVARRAERGVSYRSAYDTWIGTQCTHGAVRDVYLAHDQSTTRSEIWGIRTIRGWWSPWKCDRVAHHHERFEPVVSSCEAPRAILEHVGDPRNASTTHFRINALCPVPPQ